MKKLAILLALLIIPCTAFGLEMLTDDNMDAITGQDGVTIMADDIQLFLNVDLFAYVDTDGYDLHNGCAATGCNNGGMVAFQNFQMDVININAIVGSDNGRAWDPNYNTRFVEDTNWALASTSCGIPLFYDYADTAAWDACLSTCNPIGLGTGGNDATKGLDNYTPPGDFLINGTTTGNTGRFLPQAIMIDITDNLPVFSQGFQYIMQAPFKMLGVLITLPTMEIYIQDINFDVEMYTNDCDTFVFNSGYSAADLDSNNNSFGKFYIEGVTFTILSGWVEIAPH
jgi:hypothetical protein